jgi:hypothetical protein
MTSAAAPSLAAALPVLAPFASHCLDAAQPWALRLAALQCMTAAFAALQHVGGVGEGALAGAATVAAEVLPAVVLSSDDKLAQVRSCHAFKCSTAGEVLRTSGITC